MDGFTITCRTCGARTSFEDAGNHVCRSRPLQQFSNSYDDRSQRPSNEPLTRQRSLSNSKFSTDFKLTSGRNQFRGRSPVQDYPETNKPVREDLTLGPKFELASLRAPHSYDGPYGGVPIKAASRPMPLPQPYRPRQPMQRLPPQNGPQYEQPRQRQQQPPARPRYVEDYDYSRPNPPGSRPNPPQLDQRYPPNRPFVAIDEPMKSPLFARSNSDLEGQQFNDQRRSPERRYPDPSPERQYPEPSPERQYPEPGPKQYNPYQEERSRGRSENGYDLDSYERPALNRSPERRVHSPSSGPSDHYNQRQQETQVDETELWHQIRSRVSQKNQSISSSHSSSDSDVSRRRSEDTAASSAASPISPSKNSEYSIGKSPLSRTISDKSDHSRTGSDELQTKVSLAVCRACDEVIRGRSLASQDGKLSGRYHKRCFCCTTCHKPFETASFYVLQDRPYCKRHYHELNHSTCGECGEGVEGQCLQIEDGTIRHPACFTCHVFPPPYVS